MGNAGFVKITQFCLRCKDRVTMLKVKVFKEKTAKGIRKIATGACEACGVALRKIMPVLLILALAGCAGTYGYYVEKHLLITGTNVKSPYGSGNITIVRDVYFGKPFQNQTAVSLGVSNTTTFKGI